MREELTNKISGLLDEHKYKNEILEWFNGLKPDEEIIGLEKELLMYRARIKYLTNNVDEEELSARVKNKCVGAENMLLFSICNKYLAKNVDNAPEKIRSSVRKTITMITEGNINEYLKSKEINRLYI